MPNGGFNPACNVQLATDTRSRAIVGVEVSHEGSDSAGLSEPMRQQVEQRTKRKIQQHLLDGGYLRSQDLERAHQQKVELFLPPKPARHPCRRNRELELKPGDSEAVRAWKRRMASEAGKETYKQRAATSETVNADLRSYRGLTQITVRGLNKARCVALVVRAGLQRDALRRGAAEVSEPNDRMHAERPSDAKRHGPNNTT